MAKQSLANKILTLLDAALDKHADQDEALRAVRTLEQACAELKAQISGIPIAAPENRGDVLAYLDELAEYHEKLAASAAKPKANATTAKSKTLTDKVLAARGCATLQELHEKFRAPLD